MLTLLPVIALLTFIQAITPFVTRKSECFGVSIPQAESGASPIRLLRRRYAAWVTLAGAAAGGAMLLLHEQAIVWFTPLIFGLLGVDFAIYYGFHRRMKALKAAAGWEERKTGAIVVDTTPDRGDYPSPLWLWTYPAMIALTTAFIASRYASLPDRIPMHFDLYGNVDRYADKTLLTAYFPVLAQLFMAIIFAFCFFIIIYARRQLDPENPEQSRRQLAVFRRSWGRFILVCGALCLALFAAIAPLTLGLISGSSFLWGTLGFTAVICGWAVYLTVRVGQGGSRVAGVSSSKLISARDDDRYWKLGVFYYNPDDPSLFVEKRFGIGWTSHFARPMTYVILGGLILLTALFIYLSVAGTAS
jgi:uncharacterized membrane protein